MFDLKTLFPYKFNKQFAKPVAYFSMEFAIDQPLKIYSGGLGFLAGSHMRSAYELKQNIIGIGILWKKGYYDQERNEDRSLRVGFRNKEYSFLTDTGIVFPITIHGAKVYVKAFLLATKVFKSAPINHNPFHCQFLLTLSINVSTFAQKIDEEYSQKIKKCTTDPQFLPAPVLNLVDGPNVPSPRKHFGQIIGAPGVMHRTTEIYGYYEVLAKTSPFVTIQDIGTTEEGRGYR